MIPEWVGFRSFCQRLGLSPAQGAHAAMAGMLPTNASPIFKNWADAAPGGTEAWATGLWDSDCYLNCAGLTPEREREIAEAARALDRIAQDGMGIGVWAPTGTRGP